MTPHKVAASLFLATPNTPPFTLVDLLCSTAPVPDSTTFLYSVHDKSAFNVGVVEEWEFFI